MRLLTARTNPTIGGRSPGEYLARIASGGVPARELNSYLQSRLMDPAHLWSSDFDRRFRARQSALLNAIMMVMGKPIGSDIVEEPDDVPAANELVQQDSLLPEDVTT